MKKIVFLSLFALCLPWALSAQSVDDDRYYVPSKKKEEKTEKKKTPAADAVVVKTNAPTTVYASPGNTTIVVKDRKGNIRDVDEYNRRYDSKDYDFSQENDTLYIDEKEDDGLDGEWVNGFDGSEDDYEYATRIIRFRNPRYAISISSPLYLEAVREGRILITLRFWQLWWKMPLMDIRTDCTHMHFLPSPTVCGGIGAITLSVGAAIPIMAGVGTVGMVRAGALAGA